MVKCQRPPKSVRSPRPEGRARRGRRDNDKKRQSELSVARLREVCELTTSRSKRHTLAHRKLAAIRNERTARRRERQKAEANGEKVTRGTPRTIENLRVPDETLGEIQVARNTYRLDPNDEEVNEAQAADEFAKYFNGKTTPKVLLTTCRHSSKHLLAFVQELQLVIPNVFFYRRGSYRIKSIVKYAGSYGFTDVVVLTEHLKRPDGMYISHLPEGPTSFFKLSNVRMAREMKGSAAMTTHSPEVIMNNFTTRLGQRAARQLAALFPQRPEFHGRRAITFHNQRDFIFFRHHRYIFEDEGKKARLQEIGPRFTLKLRWMQHGTFDAIGGLMEFAWQPDMQVNRKRMFI